MNAAFLPDKQHSEIISVTSIGEYALGYSYHFPDDIRPDAVIHGNSGSAAAYAGSGGGSTFEEYLSGCV